MHLVAKLYPFRPQQVCCRTRLLLLLWCSDRLTQSLADDQDTVRPRASIPARKARRSCLALAIYLVRNKKDCCQLQPFIMTSSSFPQQVGCTYPAKRIGIAQPLHLDNVLTRTFSAYIVPSPAACGRPPHCCFHKLLLQTLSLSQVCSCTCMLCHWQEGCQCLQALAARNSRAGPLQAHAHAIRHAFV